MTEEGLRLDNPILVGWEFASEERLNKRNSIYRELVEGENAEDVLFNAVLEVAPRLAAHFARVEQRDAHGTFVFKTPDAMRSYVAATITRAHLAANVPQFTAPVRVSTFHTIFVAEKAG